MECAAAEGEAVFAFAWSLSRFVGLKRFDARLFQLFRNDLDLSAGGLEFDFIQCPVLGGVGQLDHPGVLEILHAHAGAFQLELPEVFDVVEDQIVETHSFCQAADDLPVGPGVEPGFHGALAVEEIGLETVLAGENAVAFQVGGHGKHNVGVPGRVRPGEGHRDQKVELVPDFPEPVGFREPHERVVAVGEVSLDRVGIFRVHGFVEKVREPGCFLELGVFPSGAVGALFLGFGIKVHKRLQAFSSEVRRLVDEGKPALGPV